MTSRFIWPDIKRNIKEWAQTCIQCQRNKTSRHTKSEIKQFTEPDERFSKVHIDLIGPFPPSNEYVYCLTCMLPFTIVTDHHSLCWLTNLKDPCGRLARWALRLQVFDVTVVYKSGRKHQDADCLSRSPLEYSEDMEEDIPSIVTLQNFSEEQMNDQAIRKIADKLQSSPNNSFVKIDNTLYRKNYDPMGKPWLLVVPRHLRQELLKKFHDSPTAGHLGFTKPMTE
ncbi:hypothetical protein LAZ67_12002638 [Cordylochernes scorpioides]|uniref:RNA-directed DNA polymerase n=1 Tax=Cordylochernes scorpioides TaxID=51811 RepID=A0ABY6L3T8_9ARAC|nr:hypothetical protein LAZ67_12002638 [Cordylochernes scorpioides]